MNAQVKNALTLLVRLMDTPQARDLALSRLWLDGVDSGSSFIGQCDTTSERAMCRIIMATLSASMTTLKKNIRTDKAKDIRLLEDSVINLLMLTGSERKSDMAVKAIRRFRDIAVACNETLSDYEDANIWEFNEPLKAIAAFLRPDDGKVAWK